MAEITAGSADSARASRLLPVLGAATLVQVAATASVLALTAIAPAVAGDLGVGAHWIGYQISLIYTSGMIASAVAGGLVRRHGPVRVEQMALVCFILGFLGIATGRFPVIVLASLLIGVGYGLNNPAASELLSRVTPPERRNIVFSIKQSGVPLGGILASFALPFLTSLLGWHAALMIGAAAPAFVLVLCFTLTAAEPLAAGAGEWGRGLLAEQRLIWRDPGLRALSLLGFVYSALQLSISAFAVVTLVHDSGWPVLAAGSLAAVMQFAGACGRIFWGGVANRIGGGFLTLGLLGLIGGAGCASLYWLGAMPASLQAALFLLIGFVCIGWNGVLLGELANAAPASGVGAITGAALVYTFLGVIVGPSSFATLYTLLDHYGASFLVFSLFGFAGMAIGFAAHFRQCRRRMSSLQE
ncbi:MFS transporter [Aquibium microcysteis]|uniref:MFS transporter n=1 Tax=Aquibium microcysteis TaxID=675281 RepID=UPI00165D2461|nr:MFS transporter [Aquibium microcysteis]